MPPIIVLFHRTTGLNIFNQLGKAAQHPGKFLQKQVEDYIAVHPADHQLVLKPKTVLLLCHKAVQRVNWLTDLVPDSQIGLIATIEHPQVKAILHFTPEKIYLKGDLVEGQIRLLKKPDLEATSPVYRTLIAGWNIFLGGHIPNQALPEGVRLEGDRIYYTLPKAQLRIVDALFHKIQKIQDGSALNLTLEQSALDMTSTVDIHWGALNVRSLIQLLAALGKKTP